MDKDDCCQGLSCLSSIPGTHAVGRANWVLQLPSGLHPYVHTKYIKHKILTIKKTVTLYNPPDPTVLILWVGGAGPGSWLNCFHKAVVTGVTFLPFRTISSFYVFHLCLTPPPILRNIHLGILESAYANRR